jgi:multisubunit Na+/H+ antiporter MnhC subunit
MFALMKTLHLFGLMLGAGGGMGSMMVAIQAKRAGGPPAPALLSLRKNFAMAALIGVLLLWVTGLWLWLVDYDGAMLGTVFALKILAAALILAILIAARIAMARTPAGSPPPAWLQRVGPLSGLLAYVAVALAVIVFG